MDWEKIVVSYTVSNLSAKSALGAVDGGLEVANHLLPMADQVAAATVDAWAVAIVGFGLNWLHKRLPFIPGAPADLSNAVKS